MAKKLLNERTVRRFQKLAMVSPINEMYNMRDDEGVMKEEEDMDMDMGGDEKAPEMDMGDEEGMDMDGDLELTDEEAQAIIDLGTKLEQAMGGLDDMDMGDDKGMDMDMGGEEEMGDEDLMEALRGISYVPSQGEIVNEVAQRVARRLKQAKLHEAKLNRALGKRR